MNFRLTFNKPTMEHHFRGEENAGVKVRIENETVSFLPVTDTEDTSVLPLSLSKRGGGYATVEGSKAHELAEALTAAGGPFFLLERNRGGWLTAVPWNKADMPPKSDMHMRTWFPKEAASSKVSIARDWSDLSVNELISTVHDAQRVVASFGLKGPGRPPKSVSESKKIIREVNELLESMGLSAPKRRGRPIGSKAKPKIVISETPSPISTHSAVLHEAPEIDTNFNVIFVGRKGKLAHQHS